MSHQQTALAFFFISFFFQKEITAMYCSIVLHLYLFLLYANHSFPFFFNIPAGKQAGSRDFPSDDRTVVFQLASLHSSIYDAAPSGPPTSLHPVTVNNATHTMLPPDYELPLLHWRGFFVFSFSAASQNLSQQDAVLLRLQRNPLYVFKDVQERERFPSLSLPAASERPQTCLLSETKACSCFHFFHSL